MEENGDVNILKEIYMDVETKEMKKLKVSERGITLIALIITIKGN